MPERVLNEKGYGMSNSYGYGEFVVERYLRNEGHEVIANDFNIYAIKSKFKENNLRIQEVMGRDNYYHLQDTLHRVSNHRIKIKYSDLCILRPELFFAEVKNDQDKLRKPQIVFAVALWELLGIPFKVYRLSPYGEPNEVSPITVSKVLSSEYFE